jgi:hypothetical protein
MKEIQTVSYASDDGKVFLTKEECVQYEKELENRKRNTYYFSLSHSPDLTEGRGYSGLAFFSVYLPDISHFSFDAQFARDLFLGYVLNTLKLSMVEFVMGVSPVRGFYIAEVDENKYKDSSKFYAQVGDVKTKSRKKELIAIIENRELKLGNVIKHARVSEPIYAS